MGSRTINSRVYQVGETVVDLPQNVARRYSAWEVRFTRESWPLGLDCTLPDGAVVPNTALQITVEKSTDGGANWTHAYGATFAGGDAFDSKGVLYTESALIVDFTSIETAQWRARTKVFVPLRTAITLNVADA